MTNITIKGIITHFFDEKYQYPKYSTSFLKRNILIESEGENYTISFVKDRIEFLKYCKLGTEIEVSVRLKGRMWNFQNKEYSVNELNCSSLKIIRNTKFEDYIYHNGEKYLPKKSYKDGELTFTLLNPDDNTPFICQSSRGLCNDALAPSTCASSTCECVCVASGQSTAIGWRFH